MRFSLVIAASLLPSFLVVAQSQSSELAAAHYGTDAYSLTNDTVITGEFNACVDFCDDSVVAATQTALAAYNTTAGNTPTTDPTDHTFLLWAEGNAPGYNSALSDCATAVQTLRTAILNLPNKETGADEQPVVWSLGLPSTDGFPPFTVPSATQGSGSASSNGVNDGGSQKPTGSASPTQSSHNNGAGVLSTGSWLATLGAAVGPDTIFNGDNTASVVGNPIAGLPTFNIPGIEPFYSALGALPTNAAVQQAAASPFVLACFPFIADADM
ncbi:hypothetical protein B0H19DRAFT_1275552 [Mycena capillaripes]|nr:hypothetical protein B0H19DRAFT_1275552 [Mycena capillaripes]